MCVYCDIFYLIFDILQMIFLLYVYINFPRAAYLILLHNAQNLRGAIPTKKTFDEMCYHKTLRILYPFANQEIKISHFNFNAPL
jgi:hypothetical protein